MATGGGSMLKLRPGINSISTGRVSRPELRRGVGENSIHKPGDSKWPFFPLVGGHDSPLKGSLNHPKIGHKELPGMWCFSSSRVAPTTFQYQSWIFHPKVDKKLLATSPASYNNHQFPACPANEANEAQGSKVFWFSDQVANKFSKFNLSANVSAKWAQYRFTNIQFSITSWKGSMASHSHVLLKIMAPAS